MASGKSSQSQRVERVGEIWRAEEATAKKVFGTPCLPANHLNPFFSQAQMIFSGRLFDQNSRNLLPKLEKQLETLGSNVLPSSSFNSAACVSPVVARPVWVT